MDVELIMKGLAKMQDDIINYQLDKSQEEQDRINRDFSKFLDEIIMLTAPETIEQEVMKMINRRKKLREELN